MAGRRLALLAVVLLGAGCGSSNPRLELVDLDEQTLTPLDHQDIRASVFFFTSVDCPVSNRYAPEVERLHAEYADENVAFWLVYPNPAETPEAIRKHLQDYAYNLGVLRDMEHRLVNRAGVSVTPEVAVFVPPGRLVYRGRIDNRYVDFGKARAQPTTHDLEDVLRAVVAGKSVTPRFTEAIGCYISDMRL